MWTRSWCRREREDGEWKRNFEALVIQLFAFILWGCFYEETWAVLVLIILFVYSVIRISMDIYDQIDFIFFNRAALYSYDVMLRPLSAYMRYRDRKRNNIGG